MTQAKPDLLSLATRFAQLPDAQRKAFLTKLAAAGIDFRMLPIPPRAEATARERAGFVCADASVAARAHDRRARRVSHHRAPATRRRARCERAAPFVRCVDRAPRSAAHDLRGKRGRRAANGACADALPVARGAI